MESFDLDRYLRASKRVDLTDLEWNEIAAHPVTNEEARVLTYMMDIESHTVIFLRDLLATRAAFEPDITAFLSCWVYEELWHGEAFSRFLGEAGHEVPPNAEVTRSEDPYPSKVVRNSWIRRRMGAKGYFSHVATLLGSSFVKDFPAVHMAWGAINEFSTLSAYYRLIAKTKHPVLIDMLHRVIKDERRHYAFYRNQAELRMERSSRAAKTTRWVLSRLWAPVGTGVRPQSETDFVVVWLFSGPDGEKAVSEMDAKIEEIPALRGLNLYRNSYEAAAGRLAAAAVPVG